MNLYNQVKTMFEISDIAMNVFKNLKYSIIHSNNSDELYIYNTINELELDYRDMLYKYSESINKSNRKNKIIYLKNGTKVYLKTINECIRELDGYRFKKVKFR